MVYRLQFSDGAGNPLTLSGRKDVRPGPVLAIWPDTSTLYYRVIQGHVDEQQEADAVIVGAGVLHILEADFLRQLTTFRTYGPRRADALTDFGKFFLGQLWDVYGPHFSANASQLAATRKTLSQVFAAALPHGDEPRGQVGQRGDGNGRFRHRRIRVSRTASGARPQRGGTSGSSAGQVPGRRGSCRDRWG